ncbi:MAG: hypothetical protein CMI54_02720 [Parcubacteria group bacterium]|nr:hypothetical protein [Parcubacteria group bacterium]
MRDKPLNPRDYSEAKALRQTEPYSFQRSRNAIHSSYPRPAQPNTNQPNQKFLQGWGMSTKSYWLKVSEDYSKRRGS